MKDDRYQHQVWYVKLWRRRWHLLIPWYWLRTWNTLTLHVRNVGTGHLYHLEVYIERGRR